MFKHLIEFTAFASIMTIIASIAGFLPPIALAMGMCSFVSACALVD